MDSEQILQEFLKGSQSIYELLTLSKEIYNLDKNRIGNLAKLRTKVDKLDKVIRNLEEENYILKLKGWIKQYKSILEDTVNEIQRKLGIELEEKLKNLGFRLSGQYPELKAGFFFIEVDFNKQRATIWYGPKQEWLSQCALTATTIANHIEKAKKELGSGLNEEELLQRIHSAYYRVVGGKRGEPAPIIEVLAELAYLLQSQKFRQDPRKENYRSYGRADFSYDLYRVRKYQSSNLSRLRLNVATRIDTRRRANFLWVPDDESGKGTTYSKLVFEEAEK